MVERGELERGGGPLRGWQVSIRLRWALCILLAGLFAGRVAASGPFKHLPEHEVATVLTEAGPITIDTLAASPSRVLAAALAITLGPFGAHRILLGTAPVIPVLYSITFGGFGLLVLIDLGHILFTHDLSSYTGNEQVLMWAGPKTTTPP